MEWVIAAVVVAVLGLAALAGTGALGQLRPEPVRDVYRQPLPGRPLAAADLNAVRFGVTLRGYSMRQVDELLDRLRDDLTGLEIELARWRAGIGTSPYGDAPGGEVVELDPFAEYQLDGGQGLPETGPWYDGDGLAGVETEDADADTFVQHPAETEAAEIEAAEAEKFETEGTEIEVADTEAAEAEVVGTEATEIEAAATEGTENRPTETDLSESERS